MTRNNLALLFEQQGKYVEAEAEHRAVLALREAILSPDHPHLGQSHANLGIVLRRQGKYAEAEAELRAGLTIWEAALGDDNPKVAMARHNLAAVLVDLERSTEALPLAERAWARRRQQDIPPGERAESAWLLSRILWSIDEPDRDRARARTLARDALDGYETAGVEHEAEIRDLRQWLESHDR